MDPLTIMGIGLGVQTLGNMGLGFYNTSTSNKAIRKANEANIKMNYDFAKNSIKWRKQDAIEAGINPIYALGANSAYPTASVQAEQGTDLSLGDPVGKAMGLMQLKHQQNEFKLQTDATKASIDKDKAITSYYEALTNETNMKMVNQVDSLNSNETAKQIIKQPMTTNLDKVYNVAKAYTLSRNQGGKGLEMSLSAESQATIDKMGEKSMMIFETVPTPTGWAIAGTMKEEAKHIKEQLERETGTRWILNSRYNVAQEGKVYFTNTGKSLKKNKNQNLEEYLKNIAETAIRENTD